MSKVKTVESVEDFLALLEKSKLLGEEQLSQARQACAPAEEPKSEDPKAVARQLLKEGILTNWQATQLLGGFAALAVGKYKLLDQIGKGEFSRVYLAEQNETGQRVALKTLVGKGAGDSQRTEQFLADARAAMAFEHPHLVRVVDVSSAEERPFVATGLAAQGDLQQIVDKKGPLGPRVAADLLAQAAEGMAYVHGLNMLHRDLKPANLLVEEQSAGEQFAGIEPAEKTLTVKILGTGMSPLRSAEKPGSENTGELLLSALGYSSPEQVRGKETDARSDIYALGGTLYFLLTGRVPYTATTNEERETIRKTKRPVPVSTLKADVPPDLADLCDQMMALRPADRPASMAEVADRLRQWLTKSFETATEIVAPAEETIPESKSPESKSPESKSPDAELSELAPTAATQSFVPSETVKITIDGSPATAVSVAPSGFKIHKKKKAEIAESLSATAAENADPALAAVAKKAKRQRLILIGSATASLLIMILSVAVMMLSSDGGAAQTAAGGAAASPVAAVPANPADPNDPENTPDPENIPDAAAAVEPAAAASTPVATTAATPPPASAPEPPPAALATAPAPASPTPPPATSAPVPPAAAPSATPPPTAAPATTPPATPAASPVPTPAAPATPPTPAAPPAPKSGKTFEIAAAVDLPRLPSSDGSVPAEAPAKILGKVNIDPKDACFLALQGGDKAMKGRNVISIRNAQGGTAPRDWEIVQKESSGTEAVVATLALPAQELKFEWTPDGLKSPSAGALRNCALKITAGQEKPLAVALRTVTLAPPITIENLERASLSAKFPLESLPDSSALRMEPTVPNQKIVFDAGGLDLTKGDQWIFFGENKEQAPLALKLDTTLTAKGIQVSAVPYVLIPNEKPQKLTVALHKRMSTTELQKQSAAMGEKLGQLGKMAAAANNMTKGRGARLESDMNLMKLERENIDKLVQHVQKLDELINKLNSGGKVHFRVYYDSGESPVELVKTDDGAPPAGK